MAESDWFSTDVHQSLETLGSTRDGLGEEEAAHRLETYGFNELIETKKKGPLMMFLEQFTDPLVVILIFAIIISVAMNLIDPSHGEGWVDAIVIGFIVVFNSVFGFVQEYRSEKALEALKKMAAPKAKVKRGGLWKVIDSREVVPGDIIAFEMGDMISADGRIVEAMGLSADEAVLTGESLAARKTHETLILENPVVGDKLNMVFQGCIITAGKGNAVITATGMQTEFGKIAKLVQESEKEMTPMQIDLEDMGKKVGLMILVLCAMVFFVQIVMLPDQYWLESFLVAIALAVAAIPEGLPAVVTITLAIGVQRMVKRNAIVRRLPSVETLGSTTIICSDKTGTITRNEMTIRHVYAGDLHFTVTGTGYNIEGAFLVGADEDPFDTAGQVRYDPVNDPHLVRLFTIGQMCSNTLLQPDYETDNEWQVIGDPTEGAILVAAEKAGLPFEETRPKYESLAEISFDSKRKRMTEVCKHRDGSLWAFTKGAPEVLLEFCTHIYEGGKEVPMDQAAKDRVLDVNTELAGRAMRILGLAYRRFDAEIPDWEPTEVESNLVFVGLVGMIDPPRPEVFDAIVTARKAGIRTIMITGDHELTARAIAESVGLIKGADAVIVSGAEIEDMTDDELAEVSLSVDVFARVAPEHKLRIVKALKDHDHVVAMTGDGVNDAPAVKSADVGVSMGIRGADVTKEASDVILADDNFATIVDAVEVGREIYANIRKFVRFLLSANAGEVLLVFVMVMIGLPIPLIPVQILWLNLVTDGFPALALGVDPPEKGLMDRKGREPGERMLDRGMINLIIVGGFFAFLSAGVLFLWDLWFQLDFIPGITGPTVDWSLPVYAAALTHARTAAYAGLICFELLFVFSCRDERRPMWKTEPHKARMLIAAVLFSFVLTLITIYTPLNYAFGNVPLLLVEWVVVLIVCLPALFVPYYKIFKHKDGLESVQDKPSAES